MRLHLYGGTLNFDSFHAYPCSVGLLLLEYLVRGARRCDERPAPVVSRSAEAFRSGIHTCPGARPSGISTDLGAQRVPESRPGALAV
jgi:hypothetical protein